MLIRIKQIRKLENGDPGTDIILGKGKKAIALAFRPMDENKNDREHVCDVNDADHVATLLAIKEGFEIHPSELKTAAGKAAVAAAEKAAAVEKGGGGVDVLSDDELEAELERRRAAKAEAKAGEGEKKDPASTETPDVEKMDRDELVAAVKAKTGKAPNPSTSVKKLKEMLAAE